MSETGLNIVILAAGPGERFKEAGYTTPKPLIRVFGKPMIFWLLDSLKVQPEDDVYIVYRNELNRFNFRNLVHFRYPDLDVRFVELKHLTRGPAETLYLATEKIEHPEKSLVSLDCDTFYHEDILGKFRSANLDTIICFEDPHTNPVFSYVDIDSRGIITRIAEKDKISDHACCGAYGFKSAKAYRQSYSGNNRLFGYISSVYAKMIKDGVVVWGEQIRDFHCLGTPVQLRMYTMFDAIEDKPKQIRVCFDLDNTLVSYPEDRENYATVTPIWRNINLLKFLKKQGCHIIIYTARRMRTHHGNVGAIMAEVGGVTFDTLEQFGVPYDEIHFGKPWAHFYVDDLGINPCTDDTEKATGFYETRVKTRTFNTIEYKDGMVIKTSEDAIAFKGELNWYKKKPEGLKDLFPEWLGGRHLIDSSSSLTLEQIRGTPFSYLYSHGLLDTPQLGQLFDALNRIHAYRLEDHQPNIYDSYSKKLSQRWGAGGLAFAEEYDLTLAGAPIDRKPGRLYQKIHDALQDYEEKQLGECTMIHGDPVFSNVLLDWDNQIKLIDMRGHLGDTITQYGDRFYDYAKVYQSLVGYDHILHDQEFDHDYVRKFLDAFNVYILERFDEGRLRWIKIITASLLLSLIPLHDDEAKCQRYFELAKEVWEDAN